MDLWRISNYRDLPGGGGLLVEGRWHSKGQPVVYLADHAASALLELLVHTLKEDAPSSYQLLRIEVPDTCLIEEIDISVLPVDWRDRQDVTRCIGDAWLDGGTSALLRVPSALSPRASNYLFRPARAAASDICIVETIVAPLDPRLLKR